MGKDYYHGIIVGTAFGIAVGLWLALGMMFVSAQDIEVGPIRVDTGNDWMDFWFILILIIVAAGAYILVKKFGGKEKR